MGKNSKIIFFALLFFVSLTLVACNKPTEGEDEPTVHTCVFDQKVVEEKYLYKEANCTTKAKYYKSCVCGEKGTTTFETGELGLHTWDEGTVTKQPTQEEVGTKSHTCTICGGVKNVEIPKLEKESLLDKYECITIEEAIAIANEAGSTATTEKYYIHGFVKEIQNAEYGQMLITDGTNDLFIYGTYSADGKDRYNALANKPVAGDEIVLYGTLQMYNDEPEVYAGWIIEFVAGEQKTPEAPEAPENNPIVPEGEGIWSDYELISIEYAIYLANQAGDAGTTDRYYVYGTIKTVSKPEFGEMTITDGENELYVYGSYSADGVKRYSELEEKPVAGDEVVLYVLLSTFKSEPQVKSGWIQVFNHKAPEIDLTQYPAATIGQAREAEEGTNMQVTGTVAQITYANGKIPSGVILVDGSSSIYVYGRDVAGQVEIGNTITVAATKDYYVLADEEKNAEKFGYEGCNQLSSAYLLENDKEKTALDLSFAEDSTVKALVEAKPADDITTLVYKVNALVTKAPGTGFTNYYIDDIDGVTGTYVYTQCSGGDFTWLDEFDGKICTVYVTVFNYKAETTKCTPRFLPISVVYENYEFDVNNTCDYALEYHALGQLLSEYSADPAIEMITTVSNELIGVSNVTITYTSSNTEVAYFEEVEGKVIFHTKEPGAAEITMTATYGEATKTVTVTVTSRAPLQYETITVKEAFDTADGEIVIVKGIVASSVVNQSGFYLVDETGVIAVIGAADAIASLHPGDEVIVKGKKGHKHKNDGCSQVGQNNIYEAEILVNYYGKNAYSKATFISGKTLAELTTLSVNEDYSGSVYVVEALIDFVETPYYTNVKLVDPNDSSKTMNLYCSSGKQYNFLKDFAGQVVTLELAMCNWNCKTYYTGCVISATYNGKTVINSLNFTSK